MYLKDLSQEVQCYAATEEDPESEGGEGIMDINSLIENRTYSTSYAENTHHTLELWDFF